MHDGKTKATDLNNDLVKQTFDDLNGGLGEGYGRTYTDYSRNPGAKLELQKNVFRFSAAKTYQEQARLNFLLNDEKGNRRTYREFREQAKKMNLEFNQNYLQSEVSTFQRAGAQAKKWQKYEDQKDLYPNLQYKTAGDDRVRDDHDDLADVIKPIDDPFWNRWNPPNGWRCRCYTVQTDRTPSRGTITSEPDAGFRTNPGKGKPIADDHPYFLFPEKDRKKLKQGFEQMKRDEPIYRELYKSGKNKVEGSIFMDQGDKDDNLKIAKWDADRLNLNTKIEPHINITGKKNPELLRGGIKGDRVKPESNKVSNGINNAFKDKFSKKKKGQLSKEKNAFLEIQFTYKLTDKNLQELSSQSYGKFEHYKNIDYLIIHSSKNSVKIDRKKLKEGFPAYKKEVLKIKKED